MFTEFVVFFEVMSISSFTQRLSKSGGLLLQEFLEHLIQAMEYYNYVESTWKYWI